MFVLKKNLISLTRHSKYIYKNITVINRLNLLECHRSVSPGKCQFSNASGGYTESLANSTCSIKEDENPDLPAAIDLDAITKGDKELEHKLKVIMLETEVLRQEGKAIPPDEFMTPSIWENLLKLPSRSGRTKYLGFIFKNWKKKENRMVKKLEKRKHSEEYLATKEDEPKHLPAEEHALKYGLLFNNIFLRFKESTMNHFYNGRLIQAIQFGQKLVIDCGYDQNMNRRENQNTAKQLMLLFSENRNADEPFDIHCVNMNKESELTKMLHKYIPTMYDKEFPMNVDENSYLDKFPKQKLIYLTPHCREEMNDFDHDAIYIIGAIVDKVNNEPISLAKAKREGIKMQKFPLDRYLQWGSGSGKSLTINQCVAILLDLKATGDWNYALRHVPKRKLVEIGSVANNVKSFNSKPFIPRNRTAWRPNSNNSKKFNVKYLYND